MSWKEYYLLSSHSEFTGMSYNGQVTLLKSTKSLATPQKWNSQAETILPPSPQGDAWQCLETCFGFCDSLCVYTQSCLPFATPWTVAWEVPLSMGFFRQEYRNGLPFPSPEDLPQPEIKPSSPVSPSPPSHPGMHHSGLGEGCHSEERPGLLLNVLQCPGQPPPWPANNYLAPDVKASNPVHGILADRAGKEPSRQREWWQGTVAKTHDVCPGISGGPVRLVGWAQLAGGALNTKASNWMCSVVSRELWKFCVFIYLAMGGS